MERSFTPSEGRKGIAPISDEQLKSIVDTCEVATRTRADAAAASALARQAKVDEKKGLERRVVVVCTVLAAGEMGEEIKTRRAGGKKTFMQLTHTHHQPT